MAITSLTQTPYECFKRFIKTAKIPFPCTNGGFDFESKVRRSIDV